MKEALARPPVNGINGERKTPNSRSVLINLLLVLPHLRFSTFLFSGPSIYRLLRLSEVPFHSSLPFPFLFVDELLLVYLPYFAHSIFLPLSLSLSISFSFCFTGATLSCLLYRQCGRGGWTRYLSESTATVVCIVSLNLMRRDREQNRRLKRVQEDEREEAGKISLALQGWRKRSV